MRSSETPDKRYEKLKERLFQVGYICEGVVESRTLRCGKSACGCNDDSSKRHGPYSYWVRKVKGKTRSHLLKDERQMEVIRKATKDRQMLWDTVEDMIAISHRALGV